MTALLRDGDVHGTYRSRSEAVQATATAAVNAGWSEATWRTALAGSAGDLADWPTWQLTKTGGRRRRSPADTERRLARCWKVAGAFVARRPPVGDGASVAEALSAYRDAVDRDPARWARGGGLTDRDVLHHLLDIAAKAGTLVVGRSVRDVALGTGRVPSTAAASLRRLELAGWLRQEKPTDGRDAAVWRLLTQPSPTDQQAPSTAQTVRDQVLEDLPHRPAWSADPSVRTADAFTTRRRGGLGPTAARVFDELDDGANGGLSPAQLQALTGLCAATIRRHLQSLLAVGLVTCHRGGGPGGRWARAAAAHDTRTRHVVLEQLAAALGCHGVLAARIAGIAAERAARTDFHERRGWRVQQGLYRPGQPPLLLLPRAA